MTKKIKITDLIKGALEEGDYEFQINFLVAGLMSEESNDTEINILQNKQWLSEIAEFCRTYSGNKEKEEYMQHLNKTILDFLPVLEEELLILKQPED
ncbi:MAG: hypothetical protein Q4F03_12525 [Eubacteriales bacterium]|nr:hypothetical protein [Eubacteriales bacterium]